ncbi:MAG: hypothetical protein IT361_18570 [Gemmatimonadaceae bacterium]|nr:hypothetical protein [Gemmatimonadaceae bacterium]
MNVRRVLATAALASVLPGYVHAQALPAAKDLVQAWAKAVNADGWKGHKSARSTAAFDMPAMGMSAKMELAQSFDPPMTVTKIDLPGMGEMRQGFDGTTSWSLNPMQGAQVLPEEMAAAQREDGDPGNYSRLSPAIVSSETVEKTKLNDQDCYKVKHTWKSGRVSHDCFSVADGMIVWSQTKTATPMGEMEVVTTFGAYKDFGGVKRATTTTVEQAGQQFIITLQGWEWDTVNVKEFELPPEVKALVKKP